MIEIWAKCLLILGGFANALFLDRDVVAEFAIELSVVSDRTRRQLCKSLADELKWRKAFGTVTMTITLKPAQEKIIQQQVTLGRFKSTDEVLESALRLLVEQYQDYEAWVEEVRFKVDEAKAEADRGEVIPLETVMAQLQSKFQQAREHQP